MAMDWISRNLFFNRKKKSEEHVVVDDDDDEFIDIVEEQQSSPESLESPAVPVEEKEKPATAVVKKVARRPLNHQIVCLSEAAPAPDNTANYDSEAEAEPFVVPPQRPKNLKKKIGNNHPQQQQHQLRNCIIHQPR